jgi:2-dehydro-3-deoxygalactonokinase
MSVAIIALDWGTSSLRAYLLDEAGTLLERRDGGPGIMQLESGAFAAALDAFCGDWITAHPQARLIASGMIGSKQGWCEAPYCPCPAGAADLAAGLAHVALPDGRQLAIVAGVSYTDSATGVPDVMRGEEAQIIGALPANGRHIAVLPGTHSKWAWIEDGAIMSFASFMTGEIYATLVKHSILGRLMRHDAAPDPAAFERGAAFGLEAPDALLNRVFSVRTLGLFGELSDHALASYLSGLLIGSEIGAARSMRFSGRAPVLLGSADLVRLYARALRIAGIAPCIGPTDCAASGMARILGAVSPR